MSIIENEKIGNTSIVTLNNPSKRNSMIKGFHDEFQSAIKIAEEDKNVQIGTKSIGNIESRKGEETQEDEEWSPGPDDYEIPDLEEIQGFHSLKPESA